jgi:hypothetical protein
MADHASGSPTSAAGNRWFTGWPHQWRLLELYAKGGGDQ